MNRTGIAFMASKNADPAFTDFIHFGRAVVATGLSRATIQKRMSRLINKHDFPEFTLDEMLDHFEFLSKLECA